MIQNFYIHIGTYKTGTTSIQQYLLENESELKLKDITLIDRDRDLPEVSKWLFPKWYDIEDEAKQESKAIQQILTLKEKVISCENIIYSEENFTDVLSVEEQLSRAKKLKFLIDIYSAKLTHIHVFYRDPQSLLKSWYKQLLRNRGFNYPNFQSFIHQNLNSIVKACNWKDYTKMLENTIGNVTAHQFELASQYGLSDYFLSNILHISLNSNQEKKYNESLPDLKIRLMEMVSDLAINGKLSPKNVGWLKKVICDFETTDMMNKTMYTLTEESEGEIYSLSKKTKQYFASIGQKN
ncbi:MAG: hypothetical protein AB8B80_03390 [Marinicellaceae bacterium]